jgi:hypothetical protein
MNSGSIIWLCPEYSICFSGSGASLIFGFALLRHITAAPAPRDTSHFWDPSQGNN